MTTPSRRCKLWNKNMSEQPFDIVIVGAGPGGYVAALQAGAMGARTAIVEAGPLGGTCLNNGCIPSKALLASAELIHRIKHASSFGVKVAGDVTFDWPAIQARKDKVIRGLRSGIKSLFAGRKVTLVEGRGQIASAGQVAVKDKTGATKTLTAKSIILATGSVPSRIPAWPSDTNYVCTSDESLHWSQLPKRLLIVGGGVIGGEVACMMNSFGVDVTVGEMLPGLLPTLDDSLGTELNKSFTKRGIKFFGDTKVSDVKIADNAVHVMLGNGQAIVVDKVLVATGRRPNTADIGLENVGLTVDRGFLRVNDQMETSAKGIYCIGDANGRCLLAHAASDMGVVAVKNALGTSATYNAPIPGAVYTYPEVGTVGLSEKQAREQKLPIAIGNFPLAFLGKAMAVGETEGFVKIIRHRETDAILGVHMLGHNATEIIAAAGTMLHSKATVHELAEVVFAHPTISESIKEAAEDALGHALHLPPRKVLRVKV